MNKNWPVIILLLAMVGLIWFLGRAMIGPQAPTLPPNWEITESGHSQGMIADLNIKPGQAVSSPLKVTGRARGPWYFEASFPVVLVDWDGLIIAEVPAQAQDEWMTEDFVPFEAIIHFTKPAYGERGALILRKDNPSGLPEYEAAVEIPITFAP